MDYSLTHQGLETLDATTATFLAGIPQVPHELVTRVEQGLITCS